MDPVQLTIIGISIVLTILLVILGVQVYLILKEIKTSLVKANSMLDDAKKSRRQLVTRYLAWQEL